MTPTQPAHHRFTLQAAYAALQFSLEAALSAPWTILFGPSGSGKSTLLRSLAGLLPTLPSTFSRFDRHTATWIPLHPLAPQRRLLAYAPQHALLFPHLSAADNVRFPEALHNLPRTQSRLSELTDLLDLAPLLPKRPHQLSGGERQRISLARALAVPHARLLLLDEPFAGLDRSTRDTLVPRLRSHLAARNLPVLSVTHDPDEALLLGADILRLDHGRLVAHGPASLALADELGRLRTLLDAKGLASSPENS